MVSLHVTSKYVKPWRGQMSARLGDGPGARWAQKSRDGVHVNCPGRWELHTVDREAEDGEKVRVARATLVVSPAGNWELFGDAWCFEVNSESIDNEDRDDGRCADAAITVVDAGAQVVVSHAGDQFRYTWCDLREMAGHRDPLISRIFGDVYELARRIWNDDNRD